MNVEIEKAIQKGHLRLAQAQLEWAWAFGREPKAAENLEAVRAMLRRLDAGGTDGS